MERFAWQATIKKGMLEEYIRRHDKIWPEMTAILNEAGIHNYSIWNVGDKLFGYYEAEFGNEFAAMIQAKSPIVDKWNEYMKDVMLMELDPESGAQPAMKQVFFHA